MEKIKKIISIVVSVILGIAVLLVVVAGVQIMQGNTPQILGYSFYHVMTGSMEPTIDTNANVVVKSVDANALEVGDIITFQSQDEAIYGSANTHRIIEVTTDEAGDLCYITQGDANPVADELPVYPEDIYGKVVFYTTAIYWISVFFAFTQTGVGFISVIILPIMLIAYFYMKDFSKNMNELIQFQVKEELEEEPDTEEVEVVEEEPEAKEAEEVEEEPDTEEAEVVEEEPEAKEAEEVEEEPDTKEAEEVVEEEPDTKEAEEVEEEPDTKEAKVVDDVIEGE